MPRGGMAVGIESGKRWQSGCMLVGTRLMYSKRTPIALSLARGLSKGDLLEPSVSSRHVIHLSKNTKISAAQWGSCARGAGITPWLEHRTRHRKVPGSCRRRSGGRTFFSLLGQLFVLPLI